MRDAQDNINGWIGCTWMWSAVSADHGDTDLGQLAR
jgi:hypothetical protein